uniref:Alpha-2-macroglobulin-like protein 1 n=1 Tax=Scophthalmus maximus TaxID=52904 RepID=A0A8D3DEY3_SCOMX
MDTNFIPVDRVYRVVEIQDPNSNRIAQWLDKSIVSGILDLSHPMIPEAVQGTYKIMASTDKGEQISHRFDIKEYVLPKYEVKVHLPSVISILDREAALTICGKYTYGKPVVGAVKAEFCRYALRYYWRSGTQNKDICKTYELTVSIPNKNTFTFCKFSYDDSFEVNAEIEEYGTGVTLKGSGRTSFSSYIRTVTFEDVSESYKPGIPFEGKVIRLEITSVYLVATSSQNITLTTDKKGMALFSLDTSLWEDTVNLQAKSKNTNEEEPHLSRVRSPEYRSAHHQVAAFYSKSSSFLKLMQVNKKISCDKNATVRAQFIIQGEELKSGQEVLEFFYLVCHGKTKSNNESILLSVMSVTLIYFIPSLTTLGVMFLGEAVADSQDFPIQLCLNNKVSLKFSSLQSLPAEKTTLSLKAHPGSMCSVRAIDQSVLLLKPEEELTVGSVRIPCATFSHYKEEDKKETVRTFFPETWIWDLVTVGESGSVNVEKTVPDTITKWAAGAFCTSSVGFGVSPNIGLTAFQPFFVSLTLPYSVIRGEVFTLKATVFNYLSKCIMVNVILAESNQYTFRNCEGCQYNVCLCGEESRTFSWIVTPTALGEVNLKVSAEALKTDALCGNEVATVPDAGQIDTVIRTLLVEVGVCHDVTLQWFGPVEKKISLLLPEVFVAGSARASVSVLGDLMGRAMKNLDKLLAMPYGCGEQNMVLFAPNIFILNYLQSTGQLTQEIQDKATRFLESGYQRELTYKHDDGSYSAFGKSDESGNTWLTSFVMKSFGGARPYIFVDPRHISDARRWLAEHQQPDGCIRSVGKLFHNGMKGGVSDDVSLTAYITAAMLELDANVTDPVVQKCLSCLKGAATGQLDNLYTTALLSYTFTLARDEEMRSKLITYLHQKSRGTRHWDRAGASEKGLDSLEVEMTAYVLLALLSGPIMPDFGLDYSSGIVRWLAQQQNPYGGFSSTQDTVVALQALAKYGAATYSAEGSTIVTVTSLGGLNKGFTVDQSNRLLYQEEKLEDVPGEYTILAQGRSCVLAQVQYQGRREETNMVIVNIKLLSGYVLDKSSLDLSSVKSKRVCSQLKKDETKIYSVTLEEDVPVRNLKPAVVKVYDYYQTSDEAVTDYTSPCAESMYNLSQLVVKEFEHVSASLSLICCFI